MEGIRDIEGVMAKDENLEVFWKVLALHSRAEKNLSFSELSVTP